MKVYYLIFFITLILIICFLLAYKNYYNRYLNSYIKFNCYKKRLLQPHKIFKVSVGTMGTAFAILLTFTLINPNSIINPGTYVPVEKVEKLEIIDELSGDKKVLFSYEVYDIESENNKYTFYVKDTEGFKNVLKSFDEVFEINNITYVLSEGNYYIFECETYDDIDKYTVSNCNLKVNYYIKGINDIIPFVPIVNLENNIIDPYSNNHFEFETILPIKFDTLTKMYHEDYFKFVSYYPTTNTICIKHNNYQNKYYITINDNIISIKIGDRSNVITFDFQGGKYNSINNIESFMFHDYNYHLPIPEKENYKFLGWYFSLNVDDTEIFDINTIVGNIKLFAKWESINNIKDKCYTIKFNYDEETVEYITFNNKVSFDLPVPITPNEYEFIGWYLNLEDEATRITNDTILTKDIDVYPKFELKTKIKIYLESEEGSFRDPLSFQVVDKVTLEVYKNTSSINFKNIIPPVGYSFVGWYLNDELLSDDYVFVEDTTLKAHYEKNYYTIYFNTNTNIELEPITVLYGDKIIINYKLSKNGYIFDGWDIFNDYETMPAFDVTANAIWNSNDGIKYELSVTKDSYIVTGLYNQNLESVKIKNIFLDLPVTEIASSAFEYNSYIKSITLPNSIIKINSGAFKNMPLLEEINLSNNLEIIGSYAFAYCSSLSTITIPGNVKTIGDYAFFQSNVEKVNLINGIEKIGDSVFENCKKLKTINLPNTIKTIGNSTFKNSSISIINIAEGIEFISESMFENCSNLTNIQLPSTIKKINRYAFYNTDVYLDELPINLEYIGAYSFANNTNFVDLIIPNNVKIIEMCSFINCVNLKTIKFSNNLEIINERAFYNCQKLTEIKLYEGIKEIKTEAFFKCDSLTKVNIPNSVSVINYNAFPNTLQYTIIDNFLTIDNWIFGVNDKTKTKYVVDNKYNGIAYYAFDGCLNAKEILVYENVKFVGTKAFINTNEDCIINIKCKYNDMILEESWNIRLDKQFNEEYVHPNFGYNE